MRTLVWNLLLALSWVFVTEQFTPVNLFIGFVVGYVLLLLARPVLEPSRYFSKVPSVFGLLVYFAWEVTRANFRMAYYVLSPLDRMKPGVVAVPLEPMSDIQLVILANLITLTPGTLSLDVSDDHRVLFIHAMDVGDPDEIRREVKEGFERRVLDLFS